MRTSSTANIQETLREKTIEYVSNNGPGAAKHVYEFLGISRQHFYNFRNGGTNLGDISQNRLIQFLQEKGVLKPEEIDPSQPYLSSKTLRIPDLEAVYGIISSIHRSTNGTRREKLVARLLEMADKIVSIQKLAEEINKDASDFQKKLVNKGGGKK